MATSEPSHYAVVHLNMVPQEYAISFLKSQLPDVNAMIPSCGQFKMSRKTP